MGEWAVRPDGHQSVFVIHTRCIMGRLS